MTKLLQQMNEEQILQLAEKLSDEAYGHKGIYLYSERQELTLKFNEMLQNEFVKWSKENIIKSVCVDCKKEFQVINRCVSCENNKEFPM